MDDIPFGITSDDAVYTMFEMAQDGVVLFKKVFLHLNILALKGAVCEFLAASTGEVANYNQLLTPHLPFESTTKAERA